MRIQLGRIGEIPVSKPSGRFWLLAAVAAVSLVLLQQVWHWEVERIEVPPGQFLVRIHRWGANLPEDEIVARDASYKGVMLEVLGEGRHFLNPIFWSHEFHQIKEVPAGQCLVLTRKFGTKISDERMSHGDILRGRTRLTRLKGSGVFYAMCCRRGVTGSIRMRTRLKKCRR